MAGSRPRPPHFRCVGNQCVELPGLDGTTKPECEKICGQVDVFGGQGVDLGDAAVPEAVVANEGGALVGEGDAMDSASASSVDNNEDRPMPHRGDCDSFCHRSSRTPRRCPRRVKP